MHPLTKTYLDRIETRLKRLAPDEREQQMEEIALHLQALIADNHSQGMSETDATQAALLQFGEPDKIGRGIEQQVIGGHETSLVRGILVGAIAGMAALSFPWFFALLEGGSINPNIGLGSVIERFVEAALAGAAASLVGRRFTWRYLSRPSRSWPIFSGFSQTGTVALRTMGAGLLRGATGGAVFGFINTITALLDPHSTVTLVREVVVYLVVLSLSSSLTFSLLIGFMGTIFGALRWVYGRKSTRQRV